MVRLMAAATTPYMQLPPLLVHSQPLSLPPTTPLPPITDGSRLAILGGERPVGRWLYMQHGGGGVTTMCDYDAITHDKIMEGEKIFKKGHLGYVEYFSLDVITPL